MFDKLLGARTYIIAALAALVGAYEAIDQLTNVFGTDLPDIPGFVYLWLTAGGAAALRAGVANDTAKAIAATEAAKLAIKEKIAGTN